ncbi:hypothetical protein J6S88_04765 [bacterium]|nr:hypothetical protein [bacterium]
MKRLFKLLFIFFIFLGIAILPVNSAFALKWNRSLVMIYIPKDEPYAPDMKKAVNEWQSKTKKMSIMITPQVRDIPLVEVETVFNKISGENAQNKCAVTFSSTANYFRHAVITLDINNTPEILADPEKKQENDAEVYALMLKSVGLMLGVPESNDEKSVMYKEYKKGQSILPSDVENLMDVYGWGVKRP